MINTENIDKLFLELSQFTKAKTEKELQLERLLTLVLDAWKDEATQGDGISEKYYTLYNRAMKK